MHPPSGDIALKLENTTLRMTNWGNRKPAVLD
jgi:hypothetical protein